MPYKVTDRLKEWTSYAGIVLAGAGAVIPDLIPPAAWAHYVGDAQIMLGMALTFMPQSAGSYTAVEHDAVTLLQAFTSHMPPDYADSIRPVLNSLARAAIANQVPAQPQIAAPPPVAADPAQPPPVQAVPVQAVPVQVPETAVAQPPSRVTPNLGAR